LKDKKEFLLPEEDVEYYVSRIKKGDADIAGSRALLRLFCDRAKNLKFPESPFPDPLLELLVCAFDNYLSGSEKDLEKSLGLKRRGKPVNPKIRGRNKLIAADVMRLAFDGIPLMDNLAGEGAFSIVAERNKISESKVRDIYYKYKDDGMSILVYEHLDKYS